MVCRCQAWALKMAKRKSVLTTGQVAKICNVAPRTVSKWFDTGQLQGYRIPGSKDRRIPLADLIGFMRSHGIPLNGLESEKLQVLVLDNDLVDSGLLTDAVGPDEPFEISGVRSAFEAGVAVQNLKPAVLVVDVSQPDVHAEQLCKDLRTSEALQGLKLVAVSGNLTEGQGQSLLQAGFHAYLKKPFDVRQLLDAIASVVDA